MDDGKLSTSKVFSYPIVPVMARVGTERVRCNARWRV